MKLYKFMFGAVKLKLILNQAIKSRDCLILPEDKKNIVFLINIA